MNPEKYFVTPVGSSLTSLESKKQSKMLKRRRRRNEVQNQKAAKIIAEKQREEWIKRTYNDMINSAIQGNPWCYQKYREHIGKIESPFVCTIGDYRVATGGVDRSACFKSLTGELISSAMSASQGHGNTMMPVANKIR